MINRPIRTEVEYKAALVENEKCFPTSPRRVTPEADRFDLLALLIEAYEDQHHPIGPPHPVEMIRHRMRTAGYTQAELAALLGSRARASEVKLTKKRRLTLPMILKQSREWKGPRGSADVNPTHCPASDRDVAPPAPPSSLVPALDQPAAITWAWISAAPSKMLRMRASHSTRLMGYSIGIAVAAMDLQRVVGVGPGDAGGQQLGHAGLDVAAPVAGPSRGRRNR